MMKIAEKFLSVLITIIAILYLASPAEAAKKTVMARNLTFHAITVIIDRIST